ncbi:MAG: hypothetical protein IKM61_00910 [Eubacteriaceae bacterium]|nr:hypothetical protein [Eubacteriaceae bacterium]
MSKLKFVLNKMKTMNYRKMLERAKEVAKKSGKLRIVIFFDMIYCGFKYQAGYEDYVLFNFHEVPRSKRSTYLTRGGNNIIINTLNDKMYRSYFDDKAKFLNNFTEYAKRTYFDLRRASKDDFISWAKTQETFIAKVIDGDGGKGVNKFTVSLIEDMDKLYTELIRNNMFIVEETVIQNEKMSSLNPSSINTIRVYTVYNKNTDTVAIPFSFVRIGRGGFVDNYHSGGMTSKIDVETGKILYNCSDRNNDVFETHPITGVKFVGFEIPMWEEVKSMCLSAARKFPQIGYVGWDVALTPTGALLIEGNAYPGYDVPQNPLFLPDKIGIKPILEEMTGLKL